MAFTKEEQRAHRAKRKREREADFALRGVKPQPVGRPRKDHVWNAVAGDWFHKQYGPDHSVIICAERRATVPYDSPDYPVYAALRFPPVDRGVISRSRECIEPYMQQGGSQPGWGCKMEEFENRAAAQAWLESEVKSFKDKSAAGTPSSEPSATAQNAPPAFVFRRSRLQRAADRLARRRLAAAFDRRSFDRRSSLFDRRSPFDRRSGADPNSSESEGSESEGEWP